MAKLRFNVTMSLDGYVAGPDQSLEHPLGVGGEALHEWALATRSSRATHGTEGGVTSSPSVAHFAYVRKGAA